MNIILIILIVIFIIGNIIIYNLKFSEHMGMAPSAEMNEMCASNPMMMFMNPMCIMNMMNNMMMMMSGMPPA